MAQSHYWLLTPTHKLSHWFPALRQPTNFRSTASSLVLKLIQEIKTLTFEQDGEILMLDVTCQNLIHHRNIPLISCIIEHKGDACCASSGSNGSSIWFTRIHIAKTYGNNLILSWSRVHEEVIAHV
jgi:hypothetical protein